MGWQDIVALIGAAAWIPQIIEWITKALTKPKVGMLSAKRIVVGYSDYGPYVVWSAAFSAERQDALVMQIKLTARHEKGEARSFVWDHVKETFFQIQAGADVGEFSKPSEIMALKVSVMTLTERTIIFNDPEFSADLRGKMAAVRDYHKYSQTEGDHTEALLKSKEAIQAQEFFAANMYWKEGRYTFEVEMQIVGRKPQKQNFVVSFTRADIERLQSNIPLFKTHLPAMALDEKKEQISWSYIHLPITS